MLEAFEGNNFTYTKLSPEEIQERGILGRLVGPIADTKKPTRNGRMYESALWERVFEQPIWNEKIANRCCFAELGHPTGGRTETDMEKICACLAETPKLGKDGLLYGVFDIIPTPNGQILKTLCDYGTTIGTSSRGSGDVVQEWDGKSKVDPKTYNCECWDLVLVPAVESARLNLVNESLDNSKTLNESLNEIVKGAKGKDKKVMKESLKSLGIDLKDTKKKVTTKKPVTESYVCTDVRGGLHKCSDKDVAIKEAMHKGWLKVDKIVEGMEPETIWTPMTMFEQNVNEEEERHKVDTYRGFDIDFNIEGSNKYSVTTPDGKVNSYATLEEVKAFVDTLDPEVIEQAYQNKVAEVDKELQDTAAIQQDLIDNQDGNEFTNQIDNLGEQFYLNHDKESEDKARELILDNMFMSGDAEKQVKELLDICDHDSLNKLCNKLGITSKELGANILSRDELIDKHGTDDLNKIANGEQNRANKEVEGLEKPSNEGSIQEELLQALTKNRELEKKVTELQEQLSVSNAKEVGNDGQVSQLRGAVNMLSTDSKKVKVLEKQVSELTGLTVELTEQLDAQTNRVKELLSESKKNTKLTESIGNKDNEINTLKESLNDLNTKYDNDIKVLEESVSSLNKEIELMNKDSLNKEKKSKELIEKYNKIAINAVDKYIDSQALRLGVSMNEIKNRLPQKYGFNDIDAICEELQGDMLAMNSLPFNCSGVRLNGSTVKNPLKESVGNDEVKSSFLRGVAQNYLNTKNR